LLSLFFFFFAVLGLELRAYALSHSTSPPPFFSRYVPENYLPGLALNCDPPDLCFLSSYDYRHKPPVPGSLLTLPVLYSLVTLAEGMFWVELCLPEWPKPQHL
jgi:hypothetical protein